MPPAPWSAIPTAADDSLEAVLRPRVVVADEEMLEAATRAHHRANQLCFIANSVSFPVRHEPLVTSAR